MTTMTPALDARHSDTGTQPVPWDDVVETLESAQLTWITTVRADGRPHVTPLVAVWLDDALHFATGPHEQKARNLAENPYVVLTTGCNRWDGRWKFGVGGGGFTHDVVDDRSGAEPALVFAVRPTTVLAFGKGEFTHTRYRP